MTIRWSRLWCFVVGLGLTQLTAIAPAEDETPAATNESAPAAPDPLSPEADSTATPPSRPTDVAAKSPINGTSADLEIFYVPDPRDPSRLAPVLGMDLEQLRQAWEVVQGLAAGAAAPPFTLDELALVGEVDDGAVRLEANLSLQVDREGWIRVPLRMSQATAVAPPQHEGPGDFRAHYEPQQGWTLWLRGPADSAHQVRWQLIAPLNKDAAGTSLRLALPVAATSKLGLTIPEADSTAQLAGGAGRLSQRDAAGKAELVVQGAHGDIDLRWARRASDVASPTPLDVQQWLYVELDRGRARLNNRLTVHRASPPLNQFAIRLPNGARWAPPAPPGVRITEQPAGADGRGTLNVELEEPTAAPMSVEISADLSLEESQGGAALRVAPWDVPGAARAVGFVGIGGDPRWQLSVERTQGLRPLDVGLLPVGFQRGGLSSAFALLGEPFEFTATVVARPAQVTVAPSYRLEIFADRALLRGELRYAIRGAAPAALRLATHGWTIERFALAGAEANASAADAAEVVATAPEQAGTSQGEAVFEVIARRDLPAEGQVTWTLPVPQGVESSPVQVRIAVAENVQWTAAEAAGSDWTPVASAERTAGEGREELAWRSSRPDAPLVASVRILPREVSVAALTRVVLEEQAAQVEQLFDYRVQHEPLSELTMLVPAELAAQPAWQCTLNGQGLTQGAWSVAPAAQPGEAARLKVRLPTARTGQWQLSIAYRVAMEPLAAEVTRRLELPLCAPGQGQLESNRLTATGKSTIRVQAEPVGPWRPSDESRKGQNAAALRLSCDVPAQRATLLATLIPNPTAAAVIVERAWVQTNFLGDTTAMRAAFRVLTSGRQVALSLPTRIVANSLEVWLDGERTNYRVTAQGHIELSWPDETSPRPHLVELRAALASGWPRIGRATVELPAMVGSTAVHRQYWQVILPAHVHLLDDPQGWLAEHRWGWRGLGLARRPVLDQAQLEDWSGASAEADVPSRANVYLFSSFTRPAAAELRGVTRSWLILGASGATLGLGFALLYWPALRRPWMVLLLATILGAACLWRPDTALLVGQAALAGAGLALVAAWLSRPRATNGAATNVARPLGSSIVQRPTGKSSRPTVLRPADPVPAPATTQSLPVPVVTPDSQA